MGIRKLKQNRTSKRLGYSAAASLLLISPSMFGVSRVWAATTWSATDLTGSGSFTQPFAVAVDGSGNVFVTNQGSSSPAVEELQNGTWTDLTLSGGGSFNGSSGIAVDSHDNVFVTNANNPAAPSVEELSGGTWTDITHGGTFTQPYGVAVDSAGDVFVTDAIANTIQELPNGQTTWTDITGTGSFHQPEGIAVDSAGDVFVTNYVNGTIEELVGGPGGTWTDITGTGGNFKNPIGITVDGSGDLFVADSGTNALTERQSGSSTWTALSGNGVFMSPAGIAVDAAGNLYVANTAASTGSSGGGIGGIPGGGGVPTGGTGGGSSSAVIEYTPSLAAPAQPTGLVASNTTATGTTLTWHATATATTYDVYQGGVQIAYNLTSPTYTVGNLTSSTAYTFTVSAVNSAGESPQSSSVAVNTLATAPTAPTGLVASNTTSTGTTLSWTAPTGATSFNVYQTGQVTPIATGVTSTHYTVTGLTAGQSYSFKVTAVNSGGESAPGNTASVNTLNSGLISLKFGSTSVQSGASTTVTGAVYDNNAPLANAVVSLSGTIGYWGTSGINSSETVTADVYGQFSTTWTAPTVTATTAGTLSATVTGSVYGVTPTTVSIAVSPPPIVAPGAPTGLSASGTTSTSTKLTWNAVSGATSYNLYEDNSSTPMKTGITGTSYTASGLTSGTAYSFKVSAVNAGGESTESGAAMVTTTTVAPPASSPPSLSSNTAIVDKPMDNQKYVWSIDSTNPSVSVVNGSTVVQLLGAIQSADGSVQTYQVQDGNQTINGTTVVKDGDVLVVTAADGKTTARYTISTWMDVSTAAELEQIDANQDNYQNANIRLTNDINLTGYKGWVPIDFAGTFDGQGHEVTGLTINQMSDPMILPIATGFFGVSKGQIENLGVAVTATDAAYVGAMVGEQVGGSITNSYATGTVTGPNNVGGLVGYQKDGSISDSYANVMVSYSQSSSGGLIPAPFSLGGLVGVSDNGNITNSYAIGKVSGSQSSGDNPFGPTSYLGGLVGGSHNGITGSYFDKETTGQSSGGTASGSFLIESGTSLTGVTGESDSAMKKQSTFQGWDFTKTWAISPTLNGGYPYLRAFTPKASAANDTQIQDKKSDSQKYVWSVDNANGLLSVSVVNGSTAAQLTGAIEATDGSAQTYVVQRAGQTISDSTVLKDGDVLVVTSADGTVSADYTVSTWMEVSTAAQLEQIDKNQGNYLNANIRLMNDIDLTGYSWTPIGGNDYGTFTGTLDGQGYKVTDLSVGILPPTAGDYGFFGKTSGTIENVGVAADMKVTGKFTGTLAGEQDGGSIANSYGTGSVSFVGVLGGNSATGTAGGLVGMQNSGSINASYATASVSATTGGGLVGEQKGGSINASYATASVSATTYGGLVATTGGGLVGEQKGGSINASYASGAVKGMSALNTFMGYYVSGAPSVAGGLVGSQTGGSIGDSYATGTVSGDSPGGLVGSQTGGSISDSYASGAVVASLDAQGSALSQLAAGVGGLVGYESEGTITSSYFDKDKTGQSNGVGKSSSSTQSPPTGFTGATDSAMKTQSTFQGWDFTKTWAMSTTSVNGGYPYLREIALPTSTASQTFDAAGGSSQHRFGNETVSVNVPAGAFATQETVKVSLVPASNVTESMQGLSKSKVAAVLDVSFSGAPPTKPVTVTITNSSIQAGGVVYKKTSDGKLVPLKATVVNGKATVSFTSDPTFVVLNLSQNERVITMTGHASVVPGLAQAESAHGNKTTYMPIWYVMQLLKPLGIQSTWNGAAWHLTTPRQPNLSSLVVGHGKTSIYINGTLVQKLDTVAANDPSTSKNTAYMPIWYVMQLLKRVGLQSTWDGTTWTVVEK